MNFNHSSSASILANFSLTLMKALLVLAFLGMMLMSLEVSKKKVTEGIKPPVFLIIVASWSNDVDVDIDIHLKCPKGDNINYVMRDACFAHLERDARGSISDHMTWDVGKVVNLSNKEIVSFRSPVSGEWILNVNWYSISNAKPVDVKIEITAIEPEVKVLYEKTVTLKHPKHEQHVVRFVVNENKTVDNFDESRSIKLIAPNINNLTSPTR